MSIQTNTNFQASAPQWLHFGWVGILTYEVLLGPELKENFHFISVRFDDLTSRPLMINVCVLGLRVD